MLDSDVKSSSVNGGRPEGCDVAIIGAGPYGLAVRAALRSASLDVRQFGPPMSFWRERMPEGMLIRSPWVATSFAAQGTGVSLDEYDLSLEQPLPRRMPLTEFLKYGEWFARRIAPDVDERRVQTVTRQQGGFALELADGERLRARRVIVAAGIERFAARPPAFDALGPEEAVHTTQLTRPAALAGRRVAVIGGGQSALESAALLHEAGARVEVLVRQPRVHWLTRSDRLHRLGPLTQLLYAPTDIGPAGLSRLVTFPDVFARIPHETRARLDRRAIKPAGSGWLVPRLTAVPITTSEHVVSAQSSGGGITLQLASGGTRVVDHVVLGTGFRPDIRRYAFLGPDVLAGVRSINGYPVLTHGFESSVPGLYFLGAIASGRFGPLLRFVAGADFAARRLAGGLVSGDRSPVSVSGPVLESV